MKNKIKLVYGFGINDAGYTVQATVYNKRVWCPFYRVWRNMLMRCYDENTQIKYPSYVGCTVCDEWLMFSNFKAWMEKQDWKGKQLDKDLLVNGNKIYSPDTCVFVDTLVNSFLTNSAGARGEWSVGVDLHKCGKFRSRCNNPFTRNKEYLGIFPTELEAHKAWQAKKHEYACQLADLQQDPRVADALRQRYAPDKDWTKE